MSVVPEAAVGGRQALSAHAEVQLQVDDERQGEEHETRGRADHQALAQLHDTGGAATAATAGVDVDAGAGMRRPRGGGALALDCGPHPPLTLIIRLLSSPAPGHANCSQVICVLVGGRLLKQKRITSDSGFRLFLWIQVSCCCYFCSHPRTDRICLLQRNSFPSRKSWVFSFLGLLRFMQDNLDATYTRKILKL